MSSAWAAADQRPAYPRRGSNPGLAAPVPVLSASPVIEPLLGQAQLKHDEFMTAAVGHTIGPELGIGWALSRHTAAAPIMCLKSCIGDRSLGWDLLPPGSPSFDYQVWRASPLWASGLAVTAPLPSSLMLWATTRL